MNATEIDLPVVHPTHSRRFAIVIVTMAVLIPLIYLASVGPAFAIAIKTESKLSMRMARKVYRPLFDIAPESTCSYLKQWGVSDVEAFFVMQAPKGESR